MTGGIPAKNGQGRGLSCYRFKGTMRPELSPAFIAGFKYP